MFKGKKILIGVTASIAAYKSAELIRLFKKAGAFVKVIQTESSVEFITPLTLSTLSGNDVLIKMVTDDNWNSHVDLALWADIFVIAPATAKTLSKMVIGECDNLLLATYLSSKCPVYFAPAMDLDMYKHPSTKSNINKLKEIGNNLIPVEYGELASGLIGEGRMSNPENIFSFIEKDLKKMLPLSGKRILLTAGPTYEPIDPVRFIGNRSSGRMGIAIANELVSRGAIVDLVLGPTNLEIEDSSINIHRVTTANEMFDVVKKLFPSVSIGIFSAAVSDYKPTNINSKKIKKSNKNISIKLERTVDILEHISISKNTGQFIVGFALETDNEIENARQKLLKKKLDMIILNSLNDIGAGFSHKTNKITIIDSPNQTLSFELKDKKDVAKDIVKHIISKLR